MRTLAKKMAALLLITAMMMSSVPTVLADTDLELGSLAIVVNTGGDSVLVRAGAGYDYTVLATVPEGEGVTVLDGPFAGADGSYWYEIDAVGTVGYIFARFLALPGNAPAITASSGGASSDSYSSVISGTGGDGARMRDGASIGAAIVFVVAENEAVTVLDGPLNSDGYAWYPISYQGVVGYVAGDFLGSGTAVTFEAQTTPRNTPSFQYGAHVEVSGTGGDDLRLRSDYGLDSDIIGHAAPGTVLAVTEGPYWDSAGNGWYGVDFDGQYGYVASGYLGWTKAGLSARHALVANTAPAVAAPTEVQKPAEVQKVSAPAPAPPAAPEPPSSASRGQAIVNVAMRYLGYAYVYAGASPSGFDCSGFTMYVTNLAIGRGIGRTVGSQLGAGSAVGAKNLEPGDLVFFENTYQAGLSHVGIYIGGGQMIHAGSERTGVVISNIWDSYWGPKYVGARRL